MGRIKRGGGDDGEPVRSPPGRLSFRRLHAGSNVRHEHGRGVSVSEIGAAGTPQSRLRRTWSSASKHSTTLK
jgi:hypothetical protein